MTASFVFLNGCSTSAMDMALINSPYPVQAREKLLEMPESMSCPKTPAPPKNMLFKSVYTDRSEGVSIVDKEAKKRYQKQIKNIRTFETQIVGWTNKIAKGKSGPVNFCAIKWMQSWAKRDALYGVEESFQGESLRKWALATIATQYTLLKKNVDLPSSKKRDIENWIRALSDQVISDYQKHPHNKSRNNNHMYWAAWGVMAASAALNEPSYFEWAVSKYKQGVADIQKDGILPLELERKGRAFLYHNFSLAPLVMIAETAAQNGVDLYGENNGAIHKLVRRVLTDLNSKQAYITAKARKKQDMDGVISSSSLSWMAPYYKRYKKRSLKKWIKKYQPLKSSRMGGDLTYLFDVEL